MAVDWNIYNDNESRSETFTRRRRRCSLNSKFRCIRSDDEVPVAKNSDVSLGLKLVCCRLIYLIGVDFFYKIIITMLNMIFFWVRNWFNRSVCSYCRFVFVLEGRFCADPLVCEG